MKSKVLVLLIFIIITLSSVGGILIYHSRIIDNSGSLTIPPNSTSNTSGNVSEPTHSIVSSNIIYTFSVKNKTIEYPNPHDDLLEIKVYSQNISVLAVLVTNPNGSSPFDSGFSRTVSGYYNTTIPMFFSYVNETGQYRYEVFLGEGNSSVSKSLIINVIPRLNASIKIPTRSEADLAENFSFANVTDGRNVTSYAWNIKGPNGAEYNYTGKVCTFTPYLNGSYTIRGSLLDQYGYHWTEIYMVFVNASLEIVIRNEYMLMYQKEAVAIKGQTITFHGIAQSGIRPYKYSWYINGVSVSDQSNLTVQFKNIGVYWLNFTVNDSIGADRTAFLIVNVFNPPSFTLQSNLTDIPHISSNKIYINLTELSSGEYFQLNISVNGKMYESGGDYFVNSAYFNLSLIIQNWIYHTGENTITVTTTVGLGYNETHSISVDYEADPAPNIAVQRWTIDQGQGDWLNGSASMGAAPYTYAWYINGGFYSNKQDIDPNLTTWGGQGGDDIVLIVVDSLGNQGSEYIFITVNPPLIVALQSNDYNLSSPYSQNTIYLNISGGTYIDDTSSNLYGIKYEYSVSLDPGTIETSLFADYPTQYLDTGRVSGTTYYYDTGMNTITVTITDGIGNSVTASLHIYVK